MTHSPDPIKIDLTDVYALVTEYVTETQAYDVEDGLRRFRESLERMHHDPAETARVDAIIAAAAGTGVVLNRSCPVCHRPGGFHDPARHGAHRVPAELTWRPGETPRWAR